MNNLLKRFFLVPFVALSALAFLHSLWNIVQNPHDFAWWGSLIATAPILLFLTYMFLSKQGRTIGKYYQGFTFALVGLLITLEFYTQLLPVLYAGVLGVLGILLYDFWYTSLGRINNASLEVGKKLPSFSLKNIYGEVEKSSSWEGDPFFIIFIRGNWCPLCVGQISELAKIYKKVAARGVNIKVVAAQTESHTRKLAERFDVPMQFYYDSNNAAAEKLKLLHEHGVAAGVDLFGYEADTFYPTVILVNAEQEIAYIDLTDNYRVRPKPELLLNAIRQYL